MRFIVGPRQAGKTTMAKQKLKDDNSQDLYYLWDLRSVRTAYKKNELFFTSDAMPHKGHKKWICFDEIHKYPKWKNILKGIFDETQDDYYFIITGSTKLNLLKRAGDSLAGRYFTFNLYPLTLSEILSNVDNIQTGSLIPDTSLEFIEKALSMKHSVQSYEIITQLLEYSGFPEPFLNQNKRFYNKWQKDYVENVIKEDIGPLTRITDRENIYDMYNLLPEMTGSPISESSIASHIQVSPPTVKNYLRKLEDFYLAFPLSPYSKNVKRSLIRAKKYYLYDWSRIDNSGTRFENYLACELKTKLSLWNNYGNGNYELYYIKDKQKKETDFLIIKGSEPWLLMESKLSDGIIENHHFAMSQALGNIPFIQICLEPNVASIQQKKFFRISADRLFCL